MRQKANKSYMTFVPLVNLLLIKHLIYSYTWIQAIFGIRKAGGNGDRQQIII